MASPRFMGKRAKTSPRCSYRKKVATGTNVRCLFYKHLIMLLYIPYDLLNLMVCEHECSGGTQSHMLYRTIKPLLVDAIQMNEPADVRTDGGLLHVKAGDWLIRDEQGNLICCDDTSFKCSYKILDTRNELELLSEGRPCGC